MSKFWPNIAMSLICHLSNRKNSTRKQYLKVTLYLYKVTSRGPGCEMIFNGNINMFVLLVIIPEVHNYQIISKHELNGEKSGK